MNNIEKFYNNLKKEKETIIKQKWFHFNNEAYFVIITEQEKKEYINIYILNDKYKIDLFNCLYMQDEYIYKENYKKDRELEKVAFDFYLWDKYGNEEEEE